MRRSWILLMVVVSLWGRVSAQYTAIMPPAQLPKWEHRSFMGKAGVASLEVLSMETCTSAIMIFLPKSITNWEEKYWLHFGRNFKLAYTMPPIWDRDPWPINYIAHPLQGAVFFNSLRSQNCSFLTSAAFNLFHTYLWEYVIEAVMERPSAQDLIITPVTGIALGELFHFLTKKMKRGGFSTGEKILVTVINPAYVVNNGYR
jgi:hypothetical protein